MTVVRIKGLYRVRSKGALYVYAWRGGPRLHAREGTPEFFTEYQRAVEARKALPGTDTIAGLILEFRASRRFRELAIGSRKVYERFFPDVLKEFGAAPVAAFDDPRIRRDIRKWHDAFPLDRQADKALGVLSSVLTFASEDGLISTNAAASHPKRYNHEPEPTPWTDDEFSRFLQAAPKHVADAAQLIRMTGLARIDAASLTVGQIGEFKIDLRRRKSRMRAQPPLTPELKALLQRLDRERPSGVLTILWHSRGLPWTADSLGKAFKKVAGPLGIERTPHDLRATAACDLMRRGATDEEAADIMGWSPETVRYIRRHYVDDAAIYAGRIAKFTRSNGGEK